MLVGGGANRDYILMLSSFVPSPQVLSVSLGIISALTHWLSRAIGAQWLAHTHTHTKLIHSRSRCEQKKKPDRSSAGKLGVVG